MFPHYYICSDKFTHSESLHVGLNKLLLLFGLHGYSKTWWTSGALMHDVPSYVVEGVNYNDYSCSCELVCFYDGSFYFTLIYFCVSFSLIILLLILFFKAWRYTYAISVHSIDEKFSNKSSNCLFIHIHSVLYS